MGGVPDCCLSFLADTASVVSCLAVSLLLWLWHKGERSRIVFSALWKNGRVKVAAVISVLTENLKYLWNQTIFLWWLSWSKSCRGWEVEIVPCAEVITLIFPSVLFPLKPLGPEYHDWSEGLKCCHVSEQHGVCSGRADTCDNLWEDNCFS